MLRQQTLPPPPEYWQRMIEKPDPKREVEQARQREVEAEKHIDVVPRQQMIKDAQKKAEHEIRFSPSSYQEDNCGRNQNEDEQTSQIPQRCDRRFPEQFFKRIDPIVASQERTRCRANWTSQNNVSEECDDKGKEQNLNHRPDEERNDNGLDPFVNGGTPCAERSQMPGDEISRTDEEEWNGNSRYAAQEERLIGDPRRIPRFAPRPSAMNRNDHDGTDELHEVYACAILFCHHQTPVAFTATGMAGASGRVGGLRAWLAREVRRSCSL